MSNTRLVLVRHGESRATVDRFFGGARSCLGLTDHGRAQASRLRDRLLAGTEIEATAVVSSHLPRAVETAQIVLPALGSLPLAVDPGWGEHDPGPVVDGMRYDDFVAAYGVPHLDRDVHDEIFPGGETIAQFHERVMSTLRRTVVENESGTIVVFCHGGVVDAVLRNTLQMHRSGRFELHTTNCSLTELVHVQGTKWRLVRYNDAAHLNGRPA